jgi:hypothetical protein
MSLKMKNTNIFFVIAIIFILSCCQREPIIRFGFDSTFGKSSLGLSIMNVTKNDSSIILTGTIIVSDGEVLMELQNPAGEIVFSNILESPNTLQVNETYQACEGNWKLKYRSIGGTGSIILHLIKVN